jgi:hypothetical protein
MLAMCSSATLGFLRNTRHYNPEDLHSHRCENVISNIKVAITRCDIIDIDIDMGFTKITYVVIDVFHADTDRLCGLVVRVSGYRSRGPEFDSWPHQIF